jgi:outer membrane protein OmpA-like peptidoglycan-associated protein
VLAVFNPNQVVVSGFVPTQAAKDKLVSLALANSRDPANTTVNADLLAIDPTVPADIGVRVIETTSIRFDSGQSKIIPGSPHAAEFDRIGNVMKALPNVTALVIGHADQRGSDDANYKLSAARAQSVVDYLVSTGVEASRLSSRAVGEADLLALGSDDTALALNRRTEFTLYGLLLP